MVIKIPLLNNKGLKRIFETGQPFNQLAILASQSGNKLLTVFYHVRSLALKSPFRLAMNNLEKVYHKYSNEMCVLNSFIKFNYLFFFRNLDSRQKMTSKDFADSFVQLHGLIHLNKGKGRVKLFFKEIYAFIYRF